MKPIKIRTNYYQQFNADFEAEVPAEGFGGWKSEMLEIDADRTAVVVMHAWDCGSREEYPGQHRVVEYLPRSYEISRKVFPKLLNAVRYSNMKLFHVVGPADYYKNYPGFQLATELSKQDYIEIEKISPDTITHNLFKFKSQYSCPGKENIEDIKKRKVNFLKEAMPMNNEGIAEDSVQLFALCREYGINHLIYAGFAINACLMFSPGCMPDMYKRGIMCSAFRQAVTAVENKETARNQLAKDIALWQVAINFGFVYDVDDFIEGINI